MTYLCKNCGEKFRYKATLLYHKCEKENYLPQEDPDLMAGLEIEGLDKVEGVE